MRNYWNYRNYEAPVGANKYKIQILPFSEGRSNILYTLSCKQSEKVLLLKYTSHISFRFQIHIFSPTCFIKTFLKYKTKKLTIQVFLYYTFIYTIYYRFYSLYRQVILTLYKIQWNKKCEANTIKVTMYSFHRDIIILIFMYCDLYLPENISFQIFLELSDSMMIIWLKETRCA